MKISTATFLTLSIVGCLAGASQAAVLLPGPGTSLPAGGGPAVLPLGPSIANNISSISGPGILATLTTDVYASDATSPLAGLTFVYTLTNDPSGDYLDRLTVDGFAGVNTDVGALPGSFIPTDASRSRVVQDGGDELSWDYVIGPDANLTPGATSILIVHTDATTINNTIAGVIDNTGAQGTALAPGSGSGRTPEPASLGLLGAGSLMLLRRRK